IWSYLHLGVGRHGTVRRGTVVRSRPRVNHLRGHRRTPPGGRTHAGDRPGARPGGLYTPRNARTISASSSGGSASTPSPPRRRLVSSPATIHVSEPSVTAPVTTARSSGSARRRSKHARP